MKDNFSAQADLYATFRPKYPKALYDFLYGKITYFDAALDCATGSGQVAIALADRFKEVYATDISEKQLSLAPKKGNIFYKVERAEHTEFAGDRFDLITVAQAIHWFQFEAFYKEVKRILKPGGIIAVIGYGGINVNDKVEPWLLHYYKDITGPYWDKERKYIDEAYKTIPFPFEEIEAPSFAMEYEWKRDQFIGYLNTWSSVQHYIKQNGMHPLSEELLQQLFAVWPDDVSYTVKFPLLLRVGMNE